MKIVEREHMSSLHKCMAEDGNVHLYTIATNSIRQLHPYMQASVRLRNKQNYNTNHSSAVSNTTATNNISNYSNNAASATGSRQV